MDFLTGFISFLTSLTSSWNPERILLTAVVGMLWFMIRSMARSQMQTYTALNQSQKDIASILNNHLSEIRRGLEDIHTHMAISNTIQQQIMEKLLSAALRVPESEKKES